MSLSAAQRSAPSDERHYAVAVFYSLGAWRAATSELGERFTGGYFYDVETEGGPESARITALARHALRFGIDAPPPVRTLRTEQDKGTRRWRIA